ncbi:MAG: hypothetical protein ACOYMF_05530 [Bacteroidales bacterium]
MSTKKETALTKVEGGKTAQEEIQATFALIENVPAPEQTPSVEELTKQVQKLQKQLSSIPQNLEERIKYFNEKKELIRRLTILNANIEALELHVTKLHEISAISDFETEDYNLTVEGGSGSYRKASIFTLKNPVIISEVIAFMMGRIDVKRLDIAAQIEA